MSSSHEMRYVFRINLECFCLYKRVYFKRTIFTFIRIFENVRYFEGEKKSERQL